MCISEGDLIYKSRLLYNSMALTRTLGNWCNRKKLAARNGNNFEERVSAIRETALKVGQAFRLDGQGDDVTEE